MDRRAGPTHGLYRIPRFSVKRKPDGIIHYVQSFCHRQLEDIILRQLLKNHGLNIPLLTLEFDKPANKIDARVATRIEAFLETI